jgi:murein DD-endopeptidase MepM/ murein hydrolase activator NlpD
MKSLMGIFLICLPLKHLSITSGYGYRIHPLTGKYCFHAGVDFRASHDTVYAVFSGRISSVQDDERLGINIHLEQGQLQSIYGHLSEIFVSKGDTVNAGDPIAITGATGWVTGAHLHFSVRYGSRYIDPIRFLSQQIIKQENE